MNNIIQILKGVKSKDAKTIALTLAKASNNPMITELVQMAEQGKNEQVEEFCRNICKEKGINFEENFNLINGFMQNLK